MDDKAAEVQALVRTIQVPAIPKATLQSICAVNGIPKTGNKSDLQKRIIQRKYDFFGPLRRLLKYKPRSCLALRSRRRSATLYSQILLIFLEYLSHLIRYGSQLSIRNKLLQ